MTDIMHNLDEIGGLRDELDSLRTEIADLRAAMIPWPLPLEASPKVSWTVPPSGEGNPPARFEYPHPEGFQIVSWGVTGWSNELAIEEVLIGAFGFFANVWNRGTSEHGMLWRFWMVRTPPKTPGVTEA